MTESGKKTILLVEDEAIIALAEAKMLEKAGYSVESVGSGEKAIDSIRKNSGIDLVLMDIDLGEEMDGTETASRILEFRDVPILFLSGHTEPEMVDKTEKITSYGYVVKRSGETVLLASLKMAFRLFEAHVRERAKERALRESEEELSAIYHNAPLIMLLVDADRRIIKTNKQMSEASGRTPAEIIGMRGGEALRCVNSTDDPRGCGFGRFCEQCRIRWAVVDTFATGKGKEREEASLPIMAKDGPKEMIFLLSTRLLNHRAGPTVLISIQDLSESKQTEEHLKQYKQIVSSTQDGISFVDGDYTYRFVNESCEEYSGVKAGDLVGRTIAGYLGEDVFRNEIKEKFDKCLRGDTVVSSSWFTYPKKGRRFMRVTYFPYRDLNGRITGVVVNSRDLTEERLAAEESAMIREQYGSLLKAAPVSIMVVQEGKYAFANPYGATLLGYDSPEDICGVPVSDTISAESEQLIAGRMANIEAGIKNELIELKFIRKDGSGVLSDTVSIPIQYNGKSAAMIIGRDIGRRRKAEDALMLSEERLRRAEEAANIGLLRNDPQGNPATMFGTPRDVTEVEKIQDDLRKMSEEYRTIADYTYDWEYWIDDQGNLKYMSPSCERITGYSVREFMENPSLLKDIVFPEDLPKIRFHFRGEASDFPDCGDVGIDFRITRKNGVQRWIGHRCQPVLNSDGMPMGRRGSNRDITAQKQLEMALFESETLFRRTFDQAPVGAAVVSLDFRFLRVNDVLCRITGFTAGELLALSFSDITHPDDLRDDAEVARRLSTGDINQYVAEKRYVRKDGGIVWIRLSVRLIRDSGGSPLYYLPMMEDVNERKLYIEKIEEQREYLRNVLDSVPAFIFLKDTNGRFTMVSRAFAEVMGRPEAEWLGKTVFELEPESKNAERYNQDDLEVLSEGGRVKSNIIEPLSVPDGTLWLNTQKVPLKNRRGEVVGLVCVSIDITDQKRMEEALRESEELFHIFMTNLPAYAFIKDEEGKYVYVNETFRKLGGLGPETRIGKTDFELFPEDIARVVRENDERVMRAGVGVELVESVPYRGGFQVYLVNKFPIKKNDGRVYIAGIALDISERKRMEDALSESLYEKSALLKELQHRVKNSFGMIAGLIGLELLRHTDTGVKGILESLQRRVESLAWLYTILYETGSVSNINLDEYFERIVLSITDAYLGNSNHVSIIRNCEPVIMEAKNAAVLGLIVNELLTNALKYAFPEKREGTVRIDLHREGDALLLGVSDDGIGLRPDFTIESSPGFGMQLVRLLATQVDGSLLYASGEKTVFTLRVPL